MCSFSGKLFSLTAMCSEMVRISRTHLVVVFCLGMLASSLCQDDSNEDFTAVYMVTLRQAPAAHYYGELTTDRTGSKHVSSERLNIHKRRYLFLCY